MNLFQPIGDAVQRIAQDEVEIHVPFGKANIASLMATDRGREAFKNNRHLIVALLNEAIAGEDRWVDVMHEDGHEHTGMSPSSLKRFNYFGGTDVATFLGIREDVNFPMVESNPLPYMNGRVNLRSTQASPQEAPPVAYMVNTVTRDDQGKTFDFEM
jgi:ribonucleoside-diphosphate reductase beta chain